MEKSTFDQIIEDTSKSFSQIDKKTIAKLKQYLNQDFRERTLTALELKKAANDLLKNED